ncbi:hypothetical protein F441_13082 [Phytophthora nicotianae CJ01A1]|uniref:Uncharacterized protein n=2 Tax=Phytophthora nicotianae TaxID=4792 RepID=W2GFK2_PHYNI|nr:hypothetical protein L915_12818 [Phytophthora nicotianae]ETM41597.1 hypothetical protein L914_12644 [Phytophthora nicotianae]ETP11396.1 hypothetical protein F441_13082 [Phytophthora nicotianae CJ01A1]
MTQAPQAVKAQRVQRDVCWLTQYGFCDVESQTRGLENTAPWRLGGIIKHKEISRRQLGDVVVNSCDLKARRTSPHTHTRARIAGQSKKH